MMFVSAIAFFTALTLDLIFDRRHEQWSNYIDKGIEANQNSDGGINVDDFFAVVDAADKKWRW